MQIAEIFTRAPCSTLLLLLLCSLRAVIIWCSFTWSL